MLARFWWIALLPALAGCNSRSTALPDTGASAAAQTFFDALIQQDWQQAYDVLHPDSRAGLDLARFTALAKNYRLHLGFEPTEVRVRWCDEHGSEATAHLVLLGHGPGTPHNPYKKEAAAPRMSPTGWGVVLPAQFGRLRGR